MNDFDGSSPEGVIVSVVAFCPFQPHPILSTYLSKIYLKADYNLTGQPCRQITLGEGVLIILISCLIDPFIPPIGLLYRYEDCLRDPSRGRYKPHWVGQDKGPSFSRSFPEKYTQSAWGDCPLSGKRPD